MMAPSNPLPHSLPPDPDGIDALIAKAARLHSPPEVAQSLLNLTRDEDFDIREVVDCIRRDPAMSAKLLQVVNSSRYGLPASVGNLHQAAALLGQRTVLLLAMTFSIVNTFATGAARSLYNDYLRSALTTACGASRVNRRATVLERKDAYTAGLLADVGILVMAQADGDSYLSLYRDHRGSLLVEAEQARYGFDHAAVAARLFQKWQFPGGVLSAVRRHHDEAVTEPIETATYGGSLLAEAIWRKDAEVMDRCRGWLEAHFGIDIDRFLDLAIQCRDEVALELEVFGVDFDRSIDCRQLLEQARQQFSNSSDGESAYDECPQAALTEV